MQENDKNVINTIIQLRHDTESNWENGQSTSLMAGEVAVEIGEQGRAKIKIGDGTKTFGELDYFAPEVFQSGNIAYDNGETDNAIISKLTAGKTVSNGDCAIIKRQLGSGKDKYSYTSYVYADGVWAAMDGNYSADNVYFNEDLTTTYAIGNYTLTNGSATIDAAGLNLKQVWDKMYLKEDNKISISNPAISLSVANSGTTVEVGSTFTRPTATLKITGIGSYEYGSKDIDGTSYPTTTATNVTFSSMKVGFGSDIDKTSAYNELTDGGYVTNKTLDYTATSTDIPSNYVGEGDTSFTFCAEAHHTASDRYPVTNLGNYLTTGSLSSGVFTASECKSNSKDDSGNVIAKGNITASASDGLEKTATWKITGYREGFYFGTSATEITPEDITSNTIRNLGTKSGTNYATGKKTVTIPVGAKTVIIACPSNKNGVTDVLNTTVNANMNESFGVGKTPTKVTVGGKDATATSVGNYGREYNVWTFTPPEAYGTSATLEITLG